MTWLNETELDSLRDSGYNIGKNVKISRNCEINCSELEIGDNSRIDAFNFLSGKISIGRYCHIGTHCTLSGSRRITIGDFSAFSSNIFAFTNNADYNNESLSNPTIPKQYRRKTDNGPIRIGEHVIIGAHSSVFPNTFVDVGCKFGTYSNIKGTYRTGLYTGNNGLVKFKKPLSIYYLIKDSKEL